MKVTLFIPCFNVSKSIVKVLDSIPADILEHFSEVLLIDNGSTDGTRALLEGYVARHPGRFRLFFNEQNYSLGGSTIIAIREALASRSDFLICMHSDGQADPRDLAHFFPLSLAEDFVFGSRMLPGSRTAAYSRLRHWGNLFFARLQQRILRQEIMDIGAFVAMNLHTVARYPYFRIDSGMSYFPSLVLFLASKQKLRCREFPIYWGEVRESNVNIWAYGLHHLIRLLRMWLGDFPLTNLELAHFRTRQMIQGSQE